MPSLGAVCSLLVRGQPLLSVSCKSVTAGRLFVWILLRPTSQDSGLSLVVDVLLICGRCIGKML